MPFVLNKTIRLFLDSIGKREEYQYYLQRFHASRSSAFALICPERVGFEEFAEVLAFDLEFLLRLEIFPAILLSGLGSRAMRDMLLKQDHPYELFDLSGRVLGEQAMAEIETFLQACRERQRIAVLLTTGRTYAEVLPRLTPRISRRIHLIRLRGPLHSSVGEPLMNYNFKRPDRPELDDADLGAADLAVSLLEDCPDLHISIASPWRMIEELFTVKGAGCLVRRGSLVIRENDPTRLDRNRLSALMQSSFGRRIKASAIEDLDLAFLEENYRGAALIEYHPLGWYLSKFAVETEARGEGLAGEIWSEMTAGNPPVFWRARNSNPINHWYRRHADGLHRSGDWTIFWRAIEHRSIPEIVEYALARSDDFE